MGARRASVKLSRRMVKSTIASKKLTVVFLGSTNAMKSSTSPMERLFAAIVELSIELMTTWSPWNKLSFAIVGESSAVDSFTIAIERLSSARDTSRVARERLSD